MTERINALTLDIAAQTDRWVRHRDRATLWIGVRNAEEDALWRLGLEAISARRSELRYELRAVVAYRRSL